MMRRLSVVTPLVGVLLFLTAGAAGAVGEVTVSNPTPTPGSAIAVTSTGWFPGRTVAITLTGTDGVLARSHADAAGAVHVRVVVPADAVHNAGVLSVTGTASSGVPQQIVTGVSVLGSNKGPAPVRPWGLALVIAAIAGVLLLASVTVSSPTARLAA